MITVSKNIRALYAYALLGVMAMQWLAGSMYIKATYLIETGTEMTSTEQAIAADVLDRFGFIAHVKLLDASGMKFIHGLGYAAPFIHELEVDGSIKTFTLTECESQYHHVELAIINEETMQHDMKNKICVEKLFSQFCFGESLLSKNDKAIVVAETNFFVTPLLGILDHNNPSPPPKLI